MAGWATRTTASRLNAILGEFAAPRKAIGFRKFEAELRSESGTTQIFSDTWYTTEVYK